jgi:hypothetical protein
VLHVSIIARHARVRSHVIAAMPLIIEHSMSLQFNVFATQDTIIMALTQHAWLATINV